MSPTPSFIHSCIAFGRPLWMRQRLNYALMTLWTVGAIIATRVLAKELSGPTKSFFHIFNSMGAGMMLSGCVIFAISISQSSLPRIFFPKGSEGLASSFNLPLPTAHLVLAPMVTAIGSVLSYWIAFWFLGVWAIGSSMPFLPPAIALAILVASPNTVSWGVAAKNPFAIAFCMIPLVGPLVIILLAVNHVPINFLIIPFTVLFGSEIWASLVSAPVARHSISKSPLRLLIKEKSPSKHLRHSAVTLPLKSALASQIWFHETFKIPLISASVAAFAFPILVAATQLIKGIQIPAVGPHMIPNTVGLVTWGMFPLFGFMCVSISATLIVGFNLPRPDPMDLQPMPALIATRPISSFHILQAQMVRASRCAIATCLAVGIEAVAWQYLNGISTPIHPTVGELTPPLLLLVSISLPVLFLSVQSIAMLGARLPKHFTSILRKGLPYLFGAAAFAALQITASVDFKSFVLPLAISLLPIKLILVALAKSKLEAKRLITREIFLQGTAAWGALVLTLGTAYSLLLPKGLVPINEVFAVVALVIPANRILWQLYYLDASRHIGAVK